MSKNKVEVFVAGCQVCESTIKKIKEIACSSCDVTIYDINTGCESNVCKDKAEEYNVTKVPAIAINGKLMECCSGSMFSEESVLSKFLCKFGFWPRQSTLPGNWVASPV